MPCRCYPFSTKKVESGGARARTETTSERTRSPSTTARRTTTPFTSVSNFCSSVLISARAPWYPAKEYQLEFVARFVFPPTILAKVITHRRNLVAFLIFLLFVAFLCASPFTVASNSDIFVGGSKSVSIFALQHLKKIKERAGRLQPRQTYHVHPVGK